MKKVIKIIKENKREIKGAVAGGLIVAGIMIKINAKIMGLNTMKTALDLVDEGVDIDTVIKVTGLK